MKKNSIVLSKEQRQALERKVDGEQEAHLIALTCSPVPEGYQRWTMRLLADKLVELGYFEQIDHKTVWVALKKTNSSRG